jgi:hypothetical protein
MQALLAKEWNLKEFIKYVSFKLRLRVILNYYFTKHYFPTVKEVFSNPNPYFMYASKTIWLYS